MGIFNFAIICLLLCFSLGNSLKCYTQKGCQDENPKTPRNRYHYWLTINNEEGQCAMCFCSKAKRYTTSCIVVDDDVMLSDVKKSGLLKRLKTDENDEETQAEDLKMVIKDEEMLLSPEKAKSIECGDTPSLIQDPETGEFKYPPMKYVHYYYIEKVSHCCGNSISVDKLQPSCEVRYNSRCEARIVQKNHRNRLCGMNFMSKSSEISAKKRI
uniref:uncharacterized protein LOC120347131 n=1 Tax=Styela clava TaxID=7725 RepID=UPI001939CB62|nr:uncharacterized protein LOC120347131 [Styela clava]